MYKIYIPYIHSYISISTVYNTHIGHLQNTVTSRGSVSLSLSLSIYIYIYDICIYIYIVRDLSRTWSFKQCSGKQAEIHGNLFDKELWWLKAELLHWVVDSADWLLLVSPVVILEPETSSVRGVSAVCWKTALRRLVKQTLDLTCGSLSSKEKLLAVSDCAQNFGVWSARRWDRTKRCTNSWSGKEERLLSFTVSGSSCDCRAKLISTCFHWRHYWVTAVLCCTSMDEYFISLLSSGWTNH